MSDEIEKKQVEEYNKEKWAKMQVGDGKIRIDDSEESYLDGTEWLINKDKDKN